MASYDQAFSEVAQIFHITNFNDHQKNAIRTILEEKRDVFVNLPTGFGKSIIFQALPLICDRLFHEQCQSGQGNIVVVVSPLLNLIAEQVKSLKELGIKAVSISDVESEEEPGHFLTI
jgi:superfamily II DNA helicase RecQ